MNEQLIERIRNSPQHAANMRRIWLAVADVLRGVDLDTIDARLAAGEYDTPPQTPSEGGPEDWDL